MPIRRLHATLTEIQKLMRGTPLFAMERKRVSRILVRLTKEYGEADERYWAIKKAAERRKLVRGEEKELSTWRSANKKVEKLLELLKGRLQ